MISEFVKGTGPKPQAQFPRLEDLTARELEVLLADRPRPLERRDREGALRLGDDGQDARRAHPDEARPPRPRPGRRPGLRSGRRATRLRPGRRRALRQVAARPAPSSNQSHDLHDVPKRPQPLPSDPSCRTRRTQSERRPADNRRSQSRRDRRATEARRHRVAKHDLPARGANAPGRRGGTLIVLEVPR